MLVSGASSSVVALPLIDKDVPQPANNIRSATDISKTSSTPGSWIHSCMMDTNAGSKACRADLPMWADVGGAANGLHKLVPVGCQGGSLQHGGSINSGEEKHGSVAGRLMASFQEQQQQVRQLRGQPEIHDSIPPPTVQGMRDPRGLVATALVSQLVSAHYFLSQIVTSCHKRHH